MMRKNWRKLPSPIRKRRSKMGLAQGWPLG